MLNLENAIEPPRDTDLVARFGGVVGDSPRVHRPYPCRMYKDGEDPITIDSPDAEKAAKLQGFDHISAGQMANRNMVNWFWDIEDMSAKQLVVFAQDEYEIDLPIEAGQDKLFQAVCRLTRAAPQNRNRIVLMAHTIKLNYDATLAEISRTFEKPGDLDEVETEEWEFVA